VATDLTPESLEATQRLRVWCDGTDWVIAETAERAHELRAKSCGESNPDDMGDLEDWRAISDDESIRVHDQRDDSVTTRTAAEWVAHEGKEGFLCSTEY
jgi:hypothetical protein